MIGSNESTGLTGRPSSTLVTLDERDNFGTRQAVFVGVLAVLLATGWAANHFAALMPIITDSQHLSTATIDAIFGIYALGLVPGLLVGGRASDALGRQKVAWYGSTIAVVAHPDLSKQYVYACGSLLVLWSLTAPLTVMVQVNELPLPCATTLAMTAGSVVVIV